jgi:hypothetical protein
VGVPVKTFQFFQHHTIDGRFLLKVIEREIEEEKETDTHNIQITMLERPIMFRPQKLIRQERL